MMLHDFKSSKGIQGLEENRNLPPWLKLTSFLVLGAVAVFASLQFLDSPPEPQQAAPVSASNPSQISMPLLLPGQTPDPAPAAAPQAPVTAEAAEPEQPVVEPQPAAPVQERAVAGKWLEEKVGKGDSLARIFSRLELSPTLLHNITHSGEEAKNLARIMPGQLMRVQLDDQDNFLQLVHVRSPIESLKITPDGDSYKAEIVTKKLEKRVANLSGTITNSLYESAQEAGLSDDLIMDLAFIFGWDIDFALEIRSGDQFTLIFEEEYLEGEKYRNGPILAAEFVNRGKRFRAVRYVDENGKSDYFSPDGRNMRKAFLRAPVDFRRISSRFSKSRWHPVLGKKRPHRGVDYAAAIGTPIKASGDGKVIHVGRKGGYGKTIIIQHSSRYTTLYGHLNGYRRGIKRGARVRQGDIIGYVGKTGLSTGPHLHYEFRVNGVHRNPLTVKLPDATPIAKKYRADFTRKSAPLLSQLSLLSESVLALAETSDSQ
jgi:murein DD-endopeptidase MepM/ murein hydrolase activator NlpD